SPGSIMPAYPWLFEQSLDVSQTKDKLRAMKKLGVPYEDSYIENAEVELQKQANQIVATLQKEGVQGVTPDKEIVALIAYLQRLGTDIKATTNVVSADK
ncbi:MAG: cbb3-type cytochrome c oxidase subunit II, partial [Flammeovirgaceae bacterium]|nr:cbb3-type cytochrome c oxidase subunit II [Flammeovirgaceae bacterium]